MSISLENKSNPFETETYIPRHLVKEDKPLDWDAEIEADVPERQPLPEGIYFFSVDNLVKDHFEGGKNIGPCNRVKATLWVETPAGGQLIYDNFFLTLSMQWKLSSFFLSIGAEKKKGRVKMDWDAARGGRGRARIIPRRYKGRDGADHTSYDVNYLAWEEKYFPPEEPELSPDTEAAEENPFLAPDAQLPF